MAAITTAQSGLSTATSTWVGGVVPVSGDDVTVASGHILEISGDHTWGSDTGANYALSISGTVKFSRSASSTLTLRGFVQNFGSFGAWDRGTIASPIPSSVTHRILLNSSTAPVSHKYFARFQLSTPMASFSEHGHYRLRSTLTTAAITSGSSVLNVESAAGWLPGDKLWIESGTTTPSGAELLTVVSVAGTVVTISAATANHLLGSTVCNITSNVTWEDASNLGSRVVIGCSNTSGAGSINIQNIASHALTASTFDHGGFTYIGGSLPNHIGAASPFGLIKNNAHSSYRYGGVANNVSSSGLLAMHAIADITIENSVVIQAQTGNRSSCLFTPVGGSGKLFGCVLAGGLFGVNSQTNQGCASLSILSCKLIDNSTGCQLSPGNGLLFDNCEVDGGSYLIFSTSGDATFNNCQLYQRKGSPQSLFLSANGVGACSNIYFDSCFYPNVSITPDAEQVKALATWHLFGKSNNGVVLSAFDYEYRTTMVRNNADWIGSRSSCVLTDTSAGSASKKIPVKLLTGTTNTIVFYIKCAVAPVSVVLSGGGITALTTSVTLTNQWQKITFAYAPINSSPCILEIGYTGDVYLSGLYVDDFIEFVQHYGYLPSSNNYINPDPLVTLTESAAQAITGISFATGTLTISGNASLSDIYHWLKFYEFTEQIAPLITGNDLSNLNLDANLVVTGALIGTGSISIGAHTFSGTRNKVVISSNANTYSFIEVKNAQIGTRLQIYNLNTATELFNGILAASTLVIPYTFTSTEQIRIRAINVSGTTATLWEEFALGSTAFGTTFQLNPRPDAIYQTNGIDGASVTNIAIVDGTFRVNVSTGTISIQDIYAYETTWLYSEAGVRDESRFITAIDSGNYSFEFFKIKNTTAPSVPLVITGGLAFDSVTKSAFDIYDMTGGTIFNTPDKVLTTGRAFTVADIWSAPNRDVNVASINDVPVVGSGISTDKWRA